MARLPAQRASHWRWRCSHRPFQGYNDFYGHQRGDGCIKAVAAVRAPTWAARMIWRRAMAARNSSACCPTAGLGRPRQGAGVVPGRAAWALAHSASPVAAVVTLSAGVACLVPDEPQQPRALLALTDANLYRAKPGATVSIRVLKHYNYNSCFAALLTSVMSWFNA